jgi:polyisoprenoid-binding protein YceI
MCRCIPYVLAVAFAGWAAIDARADDYRIDAVHSSVTFKIGHLGISYVHGRFNDFSGTFSLSNGGGEFSLTIEAKSVDTAVPKRDTHLRSPDFLNVKQYPQITFRSTKVTSIKGGYEVTGDFTLHGVAKSITMNLSGGKITQFPKGTQRTGFTTSLTIKRADFGMDRFAGALGDDVHIAISFEGVKK